jgi:hypothetical protein
MRAIVISFAIIVALTSCAHAEQISYQWDNGSPLIGYPSSLAMSGSVNADDFTVEFPTTLTSVRVMVAPVTHGSGFSGAMSVAIFEHAFDRPGSLIKSVNGSPVVQATNMLSDGFPVSILTLSLPDVALTPGKYWIAFHENDWGSPYDFSEMGIFFSQKSTGFPRRGDPIEQMPSTWEYVGNTQSATIVDMSFQLGGVMEIPEPSGAFASILCLSVVVASRRLRRPQG